MAEPVQLLHLQAWLPPDNEADGEDRLVVDLEIPAFNVDTGTLRARVEDLLETYLLRSSDEGELLSLADFGLLVLAQAAHDPREQ